MEAEWLGGATGPALGARFRGHVKRNEIGPVYWTTCEVTACEPGREFGFAVLMGDKALNNWHYRLTSVDRGTDVTESFRLDDSLAMKLFSVLGGQLRRRRNVRDMRKTLERIKDVVEAPDAADRWLSRSRRPGSRVRTGKSPTGGSRRPRPG